MFLVSVQEHRGGGGQGDFDNVQIEADFLPGRLPLLNQFGLDWYLNLFEKNTQVLSKSIWTSEII